MAGIHVPGLTRRKHRAQYERVLPKIGRVSKALECDYGTPESIERAQALNTLEARGDLHVIARWRDEGTPHITEIVRAVREGDYRNLQLVSIEGPTLQRAVHEFLERARNTLNPRSADQYEATLNQALEDLGPDTPLASVTTRQAEAFLYAPRETTKNGDPWSASTQGDAKTVLGAVWQLQIDRQREEANRTGAAPNLTLNPWPKAKTRKRRKTRHAWLQPEEWRILIVHPMVAGTPTAALAGLATLAGLRRGELCHLRPELDVDLEAGLIRVQPRGGEHAWAPKGYSDGILNSVREIPIVPALRDILEEHVHRGYAGKRYFLHGQWSDKPLGETTANAWAKEALEAAGLTYGRDEEDSFTLHSFRHTFFTWLVSAGIPIPTVARLGGNTPAVVLSTYAHHVPDDQTRALVALQERAVEDPDQ